MSETKIGDVIHYYNHLHVAAVKITNGELHTGDTIHIKGHTSDFTQEVASMELEHEPVDVAKAGDNVGIRTDGHVREHDEVYVVN
jgi:translation elongation factor EF-1alpha